MPIAVLTSLFLASTAFGAHDTQAVRQANGEGAAVERDPCRSSYDCPREATPHNQARWARDIAMSYPKWAALRGHEGSPEVEVVVSAQGTVSSCEITSSSGYAELDENACRSMIQFARFNPALDTEGKPTEGKYVTKITYATGAKWLAKRPIATPRNSRRWSSRVTKDLSQIAAQRGWNGEIRYLVGVRYNGRVNDCIVEQSSGVEALDFEACDLVERHARFERIETEYKDDWSRAHYRGRIVISGQ